MDKNNDVVILGEDILDPYGGAFKVTSGLSTRFPDRVFTTPISESAITGIAAGLAMRGLRPIVEIMFGDFVTLCADQLINGAAKFRWMFNDAVRVPMVVRTPMGGRRGYGPTHSQCLEKIFLGVPGMWVIAPNILGRPGNLLKQAVDCNDPVLFIENKTCYSRYVVDSVPEMTSEIYHDNTAPFATQYLRHQTEASDGLLFCYGGMVPHCLEAIEHLRQEEGLHIDMIIFTQLSPTPVAHMQHFMEKWPTEKCFYVEETNTSGGFSSEMIATVEDISTTNICHKKTGGANTPVPSSKTLESQALPQKEDIIKMILDAF